MAYDPENNPYVPGDPYSYDLKWMVQETKAAKAAGEQAAGSAAAAATSAEAAGDSAYNAGTYASNALVFSQKAEASAEAATGAVAPVTQALNTQGQQISVLEGRMDTFASLTKGSTTADAELQDIRVAADGTVYPTAGDAVRGQVTQLNNNVDFIKNKISLALTPNVLNFVLGGINPTTGASTTSTTRIRTGFIHILPDRYFEIKCASDAKIKIAYYGAYDYSSYIRTDENWSESQVIQNDKDSKDFYIKILAGYKNDQTIDEVSDLANMVSMTRIEFNNFFPLKGKYLSLLGDSISAYAGSIPEGNVAYYTGSNSGVTSATQMWWSILSNMTGLIPLVINASSGSGVTQLEDSAHIDRVPMSADSRCSNLDDGVNMPDVILIAGGVNDYTYALSAQSEPLAWNGKTAPVINNSFTEAYACMIKKLQTNYPKAIIVALSTWFTMRGNDNGYTLTHTVGDNIYTQTDYNNAIKSVCEEMHIPYIDVSDIGFNRNNFYPTYAQDSSTIPSHPNAAGHQVMGKAVAAKLINLVEGYIYSV